MAPSKLAWNIILWAKVAEITAFEVKITWSSLLNLYTYVEMFV
jgi:hypothetical protein